MINDAITRIVITKLDKPCSTILSKDTHLFNIGRNNATVKIPSDMKHTYNYKLVGYNEDNIGVFTRLITDYADVLLALEKKWVAENCELILE